MKHRLFIFLLIVSFSLAAQDNIDDGWREKSNKFRMDALAKDLLSADLNRLKAMAMSLGLKEKNTAEEYRTALADYYGIKLIPKVTERKGDKIYIDQAGELKMIKLEEVDEENLHILGKAKLRIESTSQDGKKTTRTIEADELFINTGSKEITGIGHILFKDDKLSYNGNQFYYNYDLNHGVLFEGRTQLIKGGDSGLDGAFFKGEKVVQSGKDDVTLYNGMLTTCEEYNPHYHMRVSRLWLSEKGEWGILNGLLYIGPIPYFYFPIYYHPKELIVHPAFGFRSREGWYLNTTYYIFGNQSTTTATSTESQNPSTNTNQTSSVSGVSATQLRDLARKEPVTAVYTITRDQVYNRLNRLYAANSFYQKNPKLKVYPQFTAIKLALNVFGDAYTNLGFYWGTFFYLNADFTDYPLKLMLLSDFGFSRKLWKNTDTDLYQPYDPAHMAVPYEDGNDIAGIDNTYYYLAANPLIPRTSQYFKLSGSFSRIKLNYNFQIDYVSDKSYYVDFYNRKTNFTYLDVLANALSYNVQKQGLKSFETKKDITGTSDISTIEDYLTLSMAYNFPTLFGLPLINRLSVAAESRIKFLSTAFAVPNASPNEEDSKRDKYLLSEFTAPNLTELKISGTLLDYNSFTNTMPQNIKAYQNKLKNKDAIKKDNASKELYTYLNEIKNLDASTDKKELDYRYLLPLYSAKVPTKKKIDTTQTDNPYDQILFDEEGSLVKDLNNPVTADTTIDTSSVYMQISQIDLKPDSQYSNIIPLNFTLTYDLTERYNNIFSFEANSNNRLYSTDNYYNDTVQLFFLGRLDYSKILQHFTIYNNLTLYLKGSLNLFTIKNGSLWGMTPSLTLSYLKNYENTDVYQNFLTINMISADLIASKIKEQLLSKWSATELNLNYNDTITNDLSFGNFLIEGTKLSHSVNVDLFNYNHRKEYNYRLLNQLNRNNPDYTLFNPDYSDEEIFYSNRITYDKIKSLQTTLTLNFNLFPVESDHKLSMGLSPTIKYIIPSDTLNELKNELWQDASNDLIWNSDVINEAREYVYYQPENAEKGRENIYTRIRNSFYAPEYFWDGPKYYRKMFENVTYTVNYRYMPNNNEIISLTNNFVFRLDNIGAFADRDGDLESFAIYPDESLTVNFLNSLISYQLNIAFNKNRDQTIFDWYNQLSPADKKLDNYKIMTMNNSHTFNIKLPADKFSAIYPALPKGDWLKFSSTTNFRWDRTIRDWSNNSQYNYFFLDTQTISFSAIMDIIQISLFFRNFNFVETGYGFELDSGQVKIEYEITEIPVFLQYFKLTLKPSLQYNFVINHHNYLEGTIERSFNVYYYSGNKLSVALDIDLKIAEGTKFETVLHFGIKSENRKMYTYYEPPAKPDDPFGIQLFFNDLINSFDFANITNRYKSPFKLQYISFWITHKICDWNLKFEYKGAYSDVTVNNRSQKKWENSFEFSVTWAVKSENQLMKMFNKTKVQDLYKDGEWKQPVLSLDPSES